MSGGRKPTDVIQGYFCPLQSRLEISKRAAKGSYAISEAGIEKRCGRCRELWPADTEFFFPATRRSDGLHSWCKACYLDWRYPHGRSVAVEQAAA